MGSPLKIFCLHGSLGQASDWDFIKNTLLDNGYEYFSLDLYKSSNLNFEEWSEYFNQLIDSEKSEVAILAYSLGARLALHAMLKNPSINIKKVVLVSAHPGLLDEKQKQARLDADFEWKNKLFNLEWNEFWKLWNQQEIFKTSTFTLDRMKASNTTAAMSCVFDIWSLGRQNLTPQMLKNLKIPTLWLYGEKDIKFKEIALNSAIYSKSITTCPISNAGHRAPWENPHDFMQKFLSFLDSKS